MQEHLVTTTKTVSNYNIQFTSNILSIKELLNKVSKINSKKIIQFCFISKEPEKFLFAQFLNKYRLLNATFSHRMSDINYIPGGRLINSLSRFLSFKHMCAVLRLISAAERLF